MKTLLLLASTTAALAVVAAVIAQTQQQAHESAGPSLVTTLRPRPALPPFTSPAAMQAEFVRRFEASPGFGLSRVVRPVFLAPAPMLVWNGATYDVVPPELVGLEDEPIVYAPREHGTLRPAITSTNVTRREVRKLFQHRPLTALETNALLALRAGRDLVVITNRPAAPEAEMTIVTSPRLLAFGALRAGKTCAACHQCNEGTLLGAFAYNLTPVRAPADLFTHAPALHSNLVARLPFSRL